MKRKIVTLIVFCVSLNSIIANDEIYSRLRESYDYHINEEQFRDAYYTIQSMKYYGEKFEDEDFQNDAISLESGLINSLEETSRDKKSFLLDDQLIPVKNWNGKYGFVNFDGEQIIDPIYYYCEPFSEGLSLVSTDDVNYFIDYSGEIILNEIRESSKRFIFKGSFHNGRAKCDIYDPEKNWNGEGFIDYTGEVVIPPVDGIDFEDFSEGYAIAGKYGNYGYIDIHGEWFKEQQFYEAKDFKDGMAAVQYENRGHWGYINNEGNALRPMFKHEPGNFSEGLALGYHIDDGFSYINKDGEVIIRVDDLGIKMQLSPSMKNEFREGVATIVDDARGNSKPTGFDKDGNILFIILPEDPNDFIGFYEDLFYFQSGIAILYKEFKGFGYIDQTGDILKKPDKSIRTFIWFFRKDKAIIQDMNKDIFISDIHGEIEQIN